MEFRVTNGGGEKLTGPRVRMYVMLASLTGFETRTHENKVFAALFAACKDGASKRRVITGREQCGRGWPADLRSWRFRAVWLAVLSAGWVAALTLGQSPTETILVAQVANGPLLPVIVIFLLAAVNRADLMGNYRNRGTANLLGAVVVLVTVGLGAWTIVRKFV
jgi:Mn2+/Fe2+ NRAMP family transporter